MMSNWYYFDFSVLGKVNIYIHIDCCNEKNKVMKSNAILYRMSCKGLSSKNKHYTSIERKVFLQILNNYKHVIEIKKSDNVTLKDKELVWNEICNKYNGSILIAQEVRIIITNVHIKCLQINKFLHFYYCRELSFN